MTSLDAPVLCVPLSPLPEACPSHQAIALTLSASDRSQNLAMARRELADARDPRKSNHIAAYMEERRTTATATLARKGHDRTYR